MKWKGYSNLQKICWCQTKELIAEIELLEEEVANREQHVLSLYRSIFEHCVSRAPSEQNSGVTSPAHTKQVSRKHPSIISSAFCSSKKFPFRPLQALVFSSVSGKKSSKASDAPSFIKKSDIQFEKICFDHIMVGYVSILQFLSADELLERIQTVSMLFFKEWKLF